MDPGLVERARAGDQEAFAEIVARSIGRLNAVARLLLRDPYAAGRVTAELFDPATETFTGAGPMAVHQDAGFSASLLVDGRVLIVGGWLTDDSMTAEAQTFDPATGTFARTGSLPGPRAWHGAATLADGRALIVGGYGGSGAVADGDDAFVYDPETGRFTTTASMTTQRVGPVVATLADGRVLVVCSRCRDPGCNGLGDDFPGQHSAEVYR